MRIRLCPAGTTWLLLTAEILLARLPGSRTTGPLVSGRCRKGRRRLPLVGRLLVASAGSASQASTPSRSPPRSRSSREAGSADPEASRWRRRRPRCRRTRRTRTPQQNRQPSAVARVLRPPSGWRRRLPRRRGPGPEPISAQRNSSVDAVTSRVTFITILKCGPSLQVRRSRSMRRDQHS